MGKQTKREANLLTYLNPFRVIKTLEYQISGMGYSYSLISFFKNFLLFSLVIIILGYLHKMQVIYIMVIVVLYFTLLPFSIYSQYKYLYEQKRFQELCVYLKQMKINFKSHKKIITSLRETKENFDKTDRIYPYIESAIQAIEQGKGYREALDIIEKPFKNSYIMKLHAYMILGEMEGGQTVFQALDSIDSEAWHTDTYIFQTQKYKYQNQNGLYTFIGLAISLVVVFMFQGILGEAESVLGNIFVKTSYQLYTFIYIFIDLVSYVMIKTIITGKWVREDE